MTITVEGANEHAPEFQQDRYDEQIHEHNTLVETQQHRVDDVIATVRATDADTDPNNASHSDIHYFIMAGNEDGIFDLPDPTVGC